MHDIRRRAHQAASRGDDNPVKFNPFARHRSRATHPKEGNDPRDSNEVTDATTKNGYNHEAEIKRGMEAALPAQEQDLAQDNASKGAGDLEQTTITRPLEDYSDGYPNMSAFLASDSSFGIYRSFSYLHARVLLNLQDEIVQLEKDLDALDEEPDAFAGLGRADARDASKCLSLERSNNDEEESRHKVLEKIKDKLVEYDKVLEQSRNLSLLQRPSNVRYNRLGAWLASETRNFPSHEDRRLIAIERALNDVDDCGPHRMPSGSFENGRGWSPTLQRLANAASFAACGLHAFLLTRLPVVSASSTLARRSLEVETTPAYLDASIPDYIITCIVFLYLFGSFYFGVSTRKYALTLSFTSAIFWLAMVSEDDTRFTISYRWNTLKIWLGTAFAFGCLSCQAYIDDSSDTLPTISSSSAAARRQSLLYRFLLQLFAVSTLLQVTGMALQSFRNGSFLNALPPCLTLGVLIASNIPQRHAPALYIDTEAARVRPPAPSPTVSVPSIPATSTASPSNFANLPSPDSFVLAGGPDGRNDPAARGV